MISGLCRAVFGSTDRYVVSDPPNNIRLIQAGRQADRGREPRVVVRDIRLVAISPPSFHLSIIHTNIFHILTIIYYFKHTSCGYIF